MKGIAILAAALAAVAAGCAGGGTRSEQPRELLPDLEQVAPQAVSVKRVGGRDLLVFLSAIDNLGAGPIILDARRTSTGDPMTVVQEIDRADGTKTTRTVRVDMRYVRSETHAHWHVLDFERYELRRSDGTSVGRDRKTGFCLGDRYERTSLDLPGKPEEAIWIEECGKGEPSALSVRQGISPGYGDPYVPTREGQSIDVSGLSLGRYTLVHRVNPERELRESDYENNAASALIALSRQGGRLAARLVRACPRTAVCPS